MSRGKDLVKNTGIIAIGKCGVLLIQFFLLPVYTSYLSTAEYGEYDYLISIGLFLLPIGTMLLEESMFRFLIDAKEKDEEKQIITTTMFFVVINTLCILLIVYILCYFLQYKYVGYLLFYAFSGCIYNMALGLARGKSEIKIYTLTSVVSSILTIVFNILFIVFLKKGLTGIMIGVSIAQITSALFTFVLLKAFCYFSISNFRFSVLKELFIFSYPLVPNSVSWSFVNLINRTVIINFLGESANGLFSIANKFPYLINTIYTFFYTAWRESAAKVVGSEESNDFYQYIYIQLKRLMFAFCLGLIAFLPLVFNILVNKNYTEAYYYIPALIMSMYYINLSNFYGGIFSAYKDTKIMGSSAIVGALLNLVFLLATIQYIGINGAVFGSLISNFIIFVIRFRSLRKYIVFNNDYLFHILNMTIFSLVLFSYYSDNIFLIVLSAIITTLYCIIINKEVMIPMVKLIMNRFSREK